MVLTWRTAMEARSRPREWIGKRRIELWGKVPAASSRGGKRTGKRYVSRRLVVLFAHDTYPSARLFCVSAALANPASTLTFLKDVELIRIVSALCITS